ADRTEGPSDRVEVFEHDTILDHGVRLAHLIDLTGRLQIHRPGVDALIDLQQRHPNTRVIAIDQRPETPVGIAVFRTDARMQYERPPGRRVEDFWLQNELAASKEQVRLQLRQERASLQRIRIGDHEASHTAEINLKS